MPLILKETHDLAQFSCWEIVEDLSFFENNIPYRSGASHMHKKIEQMSARMALYQLDPYFPFEKVLKKPGSKPRLEGGIPDFSLTHTPKFAAAILSDTVSVGIDIEKIAPRVLKVETRFLDPEECMLLPQHQEERISRLTLLWSIKETVFKCFGKSAVDFSRDIRINYIDEYEAKARIKFLPFGTDEQEVFFRQIGDHWLSYMFLKT